MIIILSFAVFFKAKAQNYEAPTGYHFTKHEGDVVKTADWLMRTPWGTEKTKAEAANQFILDWAQGTPDVVIELKQAIMELSDTNPQLGFIYIAQFCKYAIAHKADYNKTRANVAALEALIAKYNMEPTHKYDGDVETLIQIDKDGELAYWIDNEFSF